MATARLALASAPYPVSADVALEHVLAAIGDASRAGADLVCFPEAYVPGYRGLGQDVPPPDDAFLERAWSAVEAAAKRENIAVILGTERIVGARPRITALVVDRDGTRLGFQDKVQLDPSEDPTYAPGTERRVFTTGALTFGIAICHEGFRYPETVRWAATHGAQVVFHPHLHVDPPGTFHASAILCRAAENTCFVATVNCAVENAGTASAIVRPDGTVLAAQPPGVAGLLVADVELDEATLHLASRLRTP